jgi:hypothetical protein
MTEPAERLNVQRLAPEANSRSAASIKSSDGRTTKSKSLVKGTKLHTDVGHRAIDELKQT